jgi:tetratricopeptide (TPR) repeat protein
MVSSYLMFFLSLAFVASFEKEKEFFREIREPKPPILTLIALGFLVSFTFFIVLPTMSDANVILAIRAPAFSKERISFYKKSLSLSPLGKFQIRQFFAENTINAFYSAQTSSENMTEELKFLIEELEKSIKECPLDYRSYLRLGQVLNLYSQFDNPKIFEAEKILRKAIEISPKNQQGYWSLAQNMLYQGKFDEAIFLAQKAVDLEPNLESAHSILIQVALMAGKKDLAKQKFEEAIKINPQWEEDLRKILERS